VSAKLNGLLMSKEMAVIDDAHGESGDGKRPGGKHLEPNGDKRFIRIRFDDFDWRVVVFPKPNRSIHIRTT